MRALLLSCLVLLSCGAERRTESAEHTPDDPTDAGAPDAGALPDAGDRGSDAGAVERFDGGQAFDCIDRDNMRCDQRPCCAPLQCESWYTRDTAYRACRSPGSDAGLCVPAGEPCPSGPGGCNLCCWLRSHEGPDPDRPGHRVYLCG